MEDAIRGRIACWLNGRLEEHEFGSGQTVFGGGVSIRAEVVQEGDWNEIRVTMATEQDTALQSLVLYLRQAVASQDSILINGYQSWTETRLMAPDASIPKLQAPLARLVNTTGDYTFYNNPATAGELHSWSFTALHFARADRTRAWLDLNPNTGYTVMEWRCARGELLLRRDVGGQVVRGEMEMMRIAVWEEAGSELNRMPGAQARPVKAPATGWTSWYNYYTKITEAIILDNLWAFHHHQIPIDIFQIDDGWQPAVGDWTAANGKFPQGMDFLAQEIHRRGFRAGLWLAPLIVERDSSVYQQHPDWLVTHDGERLLEAGYNPGWGGFFHGTYYLLDLELPDVRDHLRGVFDTVLNRWGYDLVKLDFLFAAALIPRHGKSRGQLMYQACAFLRECCGDKLILGCGVPLAPAWNVFDYCRIGPDIGLGWEMQSAKLIRLRERISTHNALHNAITRRHFQAFFANDPDVFILRRENQHLDPVQQHTLFVVNQIFGDLLFTSDDISTYDTARMRLYRSAFPARPKRVTRVENEGELYRIDFEVSGRNDALLRRYFVAANLGKSRQEISMPPGIWHGSGEGVPGNLGAFLLEPYQTRIFLAVPQGGLGIAGSDLHLFPGCEVDDLELDGSAIRFGISPHCTATGSLQLCLGNKRDIRSVNAMSVKPYERNGRWYVSVAVHNGQLP